MMFISYIVNFYVTFELCDNNWGRRAQIRLKKSYKGVKISQRFWLSFLPIFYFISIWENPQIFFLLTANLIFLNYLKKENLLLQIVCEAFWIAHQIG